MVQQSLSTEPNANSTFYKLTQVQSIDRQDLDSQSRTLDEHNELF